MHRQTAHPSHRLGRPSQRATLGAGEQILVTARGQTTQQMQHLKGPAIEMATALDMQNSHDRSTWRAAETISSTSIRRMQSKVPPQVGRRLQGEQGSG
jgi:hypothetical protein